jgi:hypothetical protein
VDHDSNDNPQVIANVFNEYFFSVAQKTPPPPPPAIIMVLVISRINIVAPLTVIHHTLWLMPLTTPF